MSSFRTISLELDKGSPFHISSSSYVHKNAIVHIHKHTQAMDTGQNNLPQVSLFILNSREAEAAATDRIINVQFSPSHLLANSCYQIATLQSRACLPFTLPFLQPAYLYTAAAGGHASGLCLECHFCSHTPIATHAKARGCRVVTDITGRQLHACVLVHSYNLCRLTLWRKT